MLLALTGLLRQNDGDISLWDSFSVVVSFLASENEEDLARAYPDIVNNAFTACF